MKICESFQKKRNQEFITATVTALHKGKTAE